MNMDELLEEINAYFKEYDIDKDDVPSLQNEGNNFVYPFNQATTMLAYLLAEDYITYDDFLKLCEKYNNQNKYLHLFDMSSKTFGTTFMEYHLCGLDSDFVKQTKKHNPSFQNEYDIILDDKIRIEVKACRANDDQAEGSLSSRAYSHKESVDNNFAYHFQQIKPSCCDIFVLIGVCTDEILYWVLTSAEIQTLNISNQHRNQNEGGSLYEGQIFVTENDLKEYKVETQNLKNVIRQKYESK